MRATFITLAIDDGADPEILETRVTHTRKSRSAFDGYNRGWQWAQTCAEVTKLQVTRRARSPGVVVPVAKPSISEESGNELRTAFSTVAASIGSYEEIGVEAAGVEPASRVRHGAVRSGVSAAPGA
jgi:hypothetical protein